MKPRTPWLAGVLALGALGVRCGVALGLVETGVGLATGRFALLGDLQRQVLFFLMPLGIYGLGGLVAGAVLGLLTGGRRLPLRLGAGLLLAWLGKELLLWGAPKGLLEKALGTTLAPGLLFRGLSQASGGGSVPLLLAALLGLTLLVAPPLWRGAWPRRFVAAGLVLGLAAGGMTWSWLQADLLTVRAPEPTVPPPAGAPDVVLVTWDTVRADVLPLYGGRGIETPNLDALAERSVVFDQMVAVAPITGPSHASLLTGRMPPSHGLRSNGDMVLAADVPTLAESFRAAGYDTAAFVAAFPLLDQFGLVRGFRVYDDRLDGKRYVELQAISPRLARSLARWTAPRPGRVGDGAQLPGEVILERVAAWLPRERERPLFLWVHFFDAHGPHTPAEEVRRRVEASARAAGVEAADPEGCQDKFLLYLAEIEELDGLLGRLLVLLEERDPGLARTVLCLVADHGECFGEGGLRMTHAPSLYEATQWIPGLLHLPGDRAAGRRVPELVSQVDLAPTLAALAGVALPGGVQGTDLLPGILEDRPLARRIFREGLYMEAFLTRLQSLRSDERLVGVRTPEWKYWEWNGQPERRRLFDLRADPREEHDLAAERPMVVDRLGAVLHSLLESMPWAGATRREMSAADAAAMAALGYADDQEEEPAAPGGGR